jgi:cytochrome c-type biogenesis protein CcmH/NrfG
MLRVRPSTSLPHRRAAVLVMVIGILALLFIIGASLLMVARFERQAVEQTQSARQMQSILKSTEERVLQQLREDIVGRDAVPYNGR